MMGVQVLVMLSHVCVCTIPFALWLSSIGLAPVIMECVLPQNHTVFISVCHIINLLDFTLHTECVIRV